MAHWFFGKMLWNALHACIHFAQCHCFIDMGIKEKDEGHRVPRNKQIQHLTISSEMEHTEEFIEYRQMYTDSTTQTDVHR